MVLKNIRDTPNRHLNLSLDIPQDGNISMFTPDQMATFLRLMNIDELIVQRLHKKELDGKKFSKLKNSVLDDIGMKNPRQE
ncbi:hypothetical protein KUTeg_016641 [Tegillarca granosa]|uniref:Uncharacterized protein n=1 Tax=Tegillarca granosa TaxID=220873 RepID=A0ABQ9ELH6_TEGGR|nr:hypothetical protein KUTeg_016641 [Tegillarca granosa]